MNKATRRFRRIFKVDPSRTGTLRRQFEADLVRRFEALRRAVVRLLVEEDAFGLGQPVVNEWSDEARKKSAEARKAHAHGESAKPAISPLQKQIQATVGGKENSDGGLEKEVGHLLQDDKGHLKPEDRGLALRAIKAAGITTPIKFVGVTSGTHMEGVTSTGIRTALEEGQQPPDGQKVYEYKGKKFYYAPGFTVGLDFDKLEKAGKPAAMQRRQGWHSKSGLHPRAHAIAHEIGHVLQHEQGVSLIGKPAGKAPPEAASISQYAMGSKGEYISEAFAEYMGGSRRPEVMKALEGLLPRPTANRLTTNAPFQFLTVAQKLTAFRRWLTQQIGAGILETHPTTGEPRNQRPWLYKYVDSAYKKGALRSYMQAHARELAQPSHVVDATRKQFLQMAFGRPERVQKLELLYTRAYENLKGVTQQMSTQMSRLLADGMAHGKGPMQIARDMNKTITGIGKLRARVIARTETIHAHAEGQLDSMEDHGIEEVGAEVEWSTANDDGVCPKCEALEGKVYKVAEARGLIPLHPNCRCAWRPHIVVPLAKGRRQASKKPAPTANVWSEEARKKSVETRKAHAHGEATKPAASPLQKQIQHSVTQGHGKGVTSSVGRWLSEWTTGREGVRPGGAADILRPNDDVLRGTAAYRPKAPVVLYRAHIKGADSGDVESWTTDKVFAEHLVEVTPNRTLLTRRVHPSEILVSMAHLPKGQDVLDMEVAVANGGFAKRMAKVRGEKLEKGQQWSGRWASMAAYAR